MYNSALVLYVITPHLSAQHHNVFYQSGRLTRLKVFNHFAEYFRWNQNIKIVPEATKTELGVQIKIVPGTN